MRSMKKNYEKIGLLISKKIVLKKKMQQLMRERKLLKFKMAQIQLTLLNIKWRKIIKKIDSVNEAIF